VVSGGSYDYAHRGIDNAAFALKARLGPESGALRTWFAEHLRLCAAAMHDIEWTDSGDYARNGDDAAILAVIAHARTQL
jgi:hypothetical protein